MSTEPEHIDIDPAGYFQLAAETEAAWPAMRELLNGITPGGWHIPQDTTEQGTGTMTDQSSTPLADALAGVDATMGTEGNPYGDPQREVAALRDLAEAVRLYLAGSTELPTVAELPTPPAPITYAKGDRVAYTVMCGDGQGFGHDHIVHRVHYGRITRIREQAGPRQEDRAVIAVEKPEPGSAKYVERYVSDIAHAARDAGRQPGPPEVAGPEKVYDGYTHEQLTEAFALVKNPDNWKLPIAATVPADADRACISAAVAYFTGSLAEFIPGRRGLHVSAAGYYACIGS